MHRQALHGILTAAGTKPGPVCKFLFSNLNGSTLTGAGQSLSAAKTGSSLDLLINLPLEDAVLAPGLAEMAAAEARHQNILSTEVWKEAAVRPFDSSMPATWAFNLVRHFVMPDSCSLLPSVSALPQLNGHVSSEDARYVARLSWKASELASQGITVQPLFLSWLSRPGGPIHTPMRLNNEHSGEWSVPEGVRGVAFIAITIQAQFTTYEELSRHIVAGPAMVTVG